MSHTARLRQRTAARALRALLLAALLPALAAPTVSPAPSFRLQATPQTTTLATPAIDWPSFAWGGYHLRAAAIDAAGTYAYFGTDAGLILRMRLSDMSCDGSIPLAAAEIRVALMDEPAGSVYFATASGQIAQVHLADFTLSATLNLAAGEGGIASGLLDGDAGFAYFGTDTAPGQVIKVRLSDFTRVDTLPLTAGQDNLTSAVLDAAGGYAYFGTGTAPGHIVRVDLAGFAAAGEVILQPGQDGLSTALPTPTGGYAYFATFTWPGKVTRLRLADFVVDATLTLDQGGVGAGNLHGASLDAMSGLLYVGSGMVPVGPGPSIARIRLSDFTWLDRIEIPGIPTAGSGNVNSIVVLPSIDVAYAGTAYTECNYFQCWEHSTNVARIRLSDFTVTGLANPGENGITSLLQDGQGSVYAGLRTGQVVQMSLPGLTRTATLNLPYADDVLATGVFDPATGHAYFGTDSEPGHVIRVHLPDLTLDGVLTLKAGEDHLRAAVLHEGYAYFATSAGTVVRVRLADFTRVDALSLGRPAGSAVVDAGSGYAYFGLTGYYTSIAAAVAKVRLADFSLAGILRLDYYYRHMPSAVIDSGQGYAYFVGTDGYHSNGPDLLRVRLADFSLAGTLMLLTTQIYASEQFGSGLLDPVGGISCWTDSGIYCPLDPRFCYPYSALYTVRLSDFTQVASDEPFLYGGNVGFLMGDYAIFGADAVPASLLGKYLGSEADVTLTASADQAVVLPGSTLTYTFNLGNVGPRGATGLVLTATLPLSVTFQAASPGCTPLAGAVRCTHDNVRVGATATLTVSVLVDPAAPAVPLVVTAIAGAAQPDANPANNSAVVTTTVIVPETMLPLIRWQAP